MSVSEKDFVRHNIRDTSKHGFPWNAPKTSRILPFSEYYCSVEYNGEQFSVTVKECHSVCQCSVTVQYNVLS